MLIKLKCHRYGNIRGFFTFSENKNDSFFERELLYKFPQRNVIKK